MGISKINSFAKEGPFKEAILFGRISFKRSGISLLFEPNPLAPLITVQFLFRFKVFIKSEMVCEGMHRKRKSASLTASISSVAFIFLLKTLLGK